MDVSAMAKVYADLIVKGRKTIGEVPEQIREQAKEALVERGYSELAEGDS